MCEKSMGMRRGISLWYKYGSVVFIVLIHFVLEKLSADSETLLKINLPPLMKQNFYLDWLIWP